MKTKTIVCFFCFLLICACSDNMTTNSVQGNSNLEKFIDRTSTEPVKCLSEAVIEFMVDHPEWYASCNFDHDKPIDFEDLCWNQKPEITELKDLLELKFPNFTLNEDNTFSYKGLKYKFQVEKYQVVRPGVNKNIKLENIGVMFDTDCSNDLGEGTIFFKNNSDAIEKMHTVLTEENVDGDLIVLTLKEITPVPGSKISSSPGTYLVLDALQIKNDTDSGSAEEIEIFVMGYQSSLYYSSVTNHKFDGEDHIDAAGDLKTYPDINTVTGNYVDCNDIAILRLTDDFEQRMIVVESDYGDGKMAHDENTAYDDYYRCFVNIYSWDVTDINGNTLQQNQTRLFRLCYENEENNDDVWTQSEVRGLKKSTVSTSLMTIQTTYANYKIKKVTY